MWTQPRGAALGLHRISRSTRAQAAGDPSDGGWRKNPSATPRSPNKKAGKLAPREAVPPRWSSLDTGVTYGDRLTRMTRRQIRVGRHARRSYQNWVRTRVSPPEVASRETAADDRASPTVAREPPGVRNNAVAPSSPLAPYWTDRSFPPAIESETGTSEAEEDATLVNEFRDAAGAPFTVELSNEDAPPGLTKIELRGMDRANLLGALCSASRASTSLWCPEPYLPAPTAACATPCTFVARAARWTRMIFSRVSLQVLAACWNSVCRDWLRTRRPAGKYLTAAAPSPANTTRLQRELALAEARTRAVSARPRTPPLGSRPTRGRTSTNPSSARWKTRCVKSPRRARASPRDLAPSRGIPPPSTRSTSARTRRHPSPPRSLGWVESAATRKNRRARRTLWKRGSRARRRSCAGWRT